jgi:hypothetical protein
MAEMTASVGLLEHFAELKDPRSRCSPHGLLELLLTAIAAVLSGADNWVAVAALGAGQTGLVAAVPAVCQRYSLP